MIDPDTTTEITEDAQGVNITLCEPVRGRNISAEGACEAYRTDQVEVRNICGRGGRRFNKGEEGYCGAHQKYYIFGSQKDFQIFTHANSEPNQFTF
ncbi:hypothetical protein [Paraherbaspirillum soli]|uniref:Uncharacterized protein n=1 Tax=Paraherbaspirillum soli TaxID=631222 RepID=A0ABW0MEX3_9BURK